MDRSRSDELANSFLAWNALKLAPYDPKVNKPQDLGLGGPSTEYTATIDMPDGSWKNIPQIWFNKQGKAQLVDEDSARFLSDLTERVTGRRFPTYETLDQANKDAEKRSMQGGAERMSLLDYADWIKRYR